MKNVELVKVRRQFDDNHILDLEGAVRTELERAGAAWTPGSSIAVTAGSRGVANIALITKTVVGFLKEQGVHPFIVPAMGSHGGATAEGQAALLRSYGITEEYTGAPIRSSMQVVELPSGDSGAKVYMDKLACESDGVVVINRVKVHTDFHGPNESGLLKMLVIGLGKHRQAIEAHSYGASGLREKIPAIAREILNSGKIKLGLGLVENAYDQTMKVAAMLPHEMEKKEQALLELNRQHMPSLPVDRLDILLVDWMGKEISGSGMDTNIIGRLVIRGERDPEKPVIGTIVTADLTEHSGGNAAGVGLADVITKRLFDKIDLHATYENSLTSAFPDRAKLPIIAEGDAKAIEYALRLESRVRGGLRMARIHSTLKLDELYVSPAVLEELRGREDIEILGEPVPLLDREGNFILF